MIHLLSPLSVAAPSLSRIFKGCTGHQRTDFGLYPDRSHWTCLEPGREEVADHVLAWIEARESESTGSNRIPVEAQPQAAA